MSAAPADLLFTGGSVATLNPARSRATTVAVTGGRISAVGHDEVRELIGPHTEVVDLTGRMLLPGFQDAHIHPVLAGLEHARCNLTGTSDAASTLAAVRTYADEHPELPWIVGGGWSMEAFDGGTPTARLLDTVVRDRPVFLPNRDHHGGWANTRAMDLAGITRDTPDPVGGRIERDADGEPTGMFQESAMELIGCHTPQHTPDDRLKALLYAQQYLHSLGITAWQDALLGDASGIADVSDAYLTAARDGSLTARVAGALWWDRDRGADQIPELLQRRSRLRVGRMRADTVKMMLDGVAESRTAAMISPYLDGCGCPTAHSGTSFVDPEHLRDYVTELDALGFQVHFHALGDRAVREALDAVDAARTTNGFRDTRPHLAHLQVVHPSDIARFRALGVTANMQPLWAAHEPQMDELTIPFLGDERARRQYPFGSLLRAGATMAAGSDWPVSSADPIHGIHVAVNRVLPGDDGRDHPVFLPEQRLDLTAALTAYTAGSAYVNRLDDTGSIEVGKLADLVVLDRDPFTVSDDAIADTRVALTYVGGDRVYTAPNA
ncbi:amidohydrolase [Rhodococcus jostii]|uniref:Amidohydrolase 3 domain-containing protein n=1 Tax=Rhodococcus jostii TaxID=132919 RepID=A0A1H5MG05_RHOJO|nr:amidohydrolase [Rhodococcus jostii]SEE87647.1 hypothetical protein SAMN04490220_8903 [Rhodococcus jostii]